MELLVRKTSFCAITDCALMCVAEGDCALMKLLQGFRMREAIYISGSYRDYRFHRFHQIQKLRRGTPPGAVVSYLQDVCLEFFGEVLRQPPLGFVLDICCKKKAWTRAVVAQHDG